ncbi:YkvI family membrane protein [Treponema sp.]|uniref:YkvI family membrane protein n=1 Tax=Treponema sp. TaxID=166 RepID=UPI003FA2F215
MIDKNKMPVAIGVAFVWFTTQFGGGFASGAQLYQFFIRYGIWTLLMPILAQAFGAFFQWYGLKYARKHDCYDYRTFNDKFYGKLAPVFSNLYELIYITLLCVAPSVAFATGGATMQKLTGLPYMVCTAIIGVFIFIIAIYGTTVVRKAASTLSVIIIAGLLLVYVPNIVVLWKDITGTLSEMSAAPAPIGPALWKFFVYGSFQLASIGLLFQHAKPFSSEKEAKTSMIYGFIVNAALIMLCTIGLLAVAREPGIAKVPVPTLEIVQKGVGAKIITPIISILIILGAVSTAVNMIAGGVERIINKFEKPEKKAAANGKPTVMTLISAFLFTLLAFAIAQFGLLALVAKGYGFLGYLTIPVIVIPYIIHMIVTKFDSKPAV